MSHFDPVTARLVLALARDGSIARAAEHEGIAPSAISRRIADLEARLEVVLFDRSAFGVTPTAAGEEYAQGCRRIFREIADLETAMGGYADGKAGELQIASSSSALSGRLPELLAEYARANPGVTLEIKEMAARASLSALEDAQVDLAIVVDSYDFSRFEVSPFEDDHVWVIASPDHPLAARMGTRKPLRFVETVAHEVVRVHHTGALDRLLNDAAQKAGQALHGRVNVEGFPAMVRMVEAGFGIGFLRNSSIHLLAGTDLVYAPLGEDWAKRQLLIARRKKGPVSAPVEAFLELSAKTFAPMRG
ncbi:LysR family transcriptional regulator [Pelagibacterium halotolerans]|uniref:LysR family transcriptional regulator n=1 Tax=Pelagibacterium halotolerans TaxID=531813 RepID=UPI00384F28C4